VETLTVWLNRGLDLVPGSNWVHRRILANLEMTDVQMPLGRGGAGLNGLKIAFISDIHAGSYLGRLDLCRLFESISAEEPDLVCLGGDLINSREHELEKLCEPLSRLRPPLGVFAVPGNHDHDYTGHIDSWRGFLEDRGVRVLLNRGERIERNGAGLWLCGVDDLSVGDPDLDAALEGRNPNEPTVLLAHHPDYFRESVRRGVDLTLSGHTHGGQVMLFGWVPVLHSEYGFHAGAFEHDGCKMYVGRGLGVTVLPVRVGARSEVPIVTLRRD
jgi:predicted MPP superfamily phosphohydrolase